MDIPTDLPGILSEFGLPVGAGALAWGLVKGADALEEDAKEERLKYISDLLEDTSFSSFGELGASVVPFIFEHVFGSRAFSFKFISRSIVATALFWDMLGAVKHINTISLFYQQYMSMSANLMLDQTIHKYWAYSGIIAAFILLLSCLAFSIIDWLSLAKSKVLLKAMSRNKFMLWAAIFVIVDVTATLLLLVLGESY